MVLKTPSLLHYICWLKRTRATSFSNISLKVSSRHLGLDIVRDPQMNSLTVHYWSRRDLPAREWLNTPLALVSTTLLSASSANITPSTPAEAAWIHLSAVSLGQMYLISSSLALLAGPIPHFRTTSACAYSKVIVVAGANQGLGRYTALSQQAFGPCEAKLVALN